MRRFSRSGWWLGALLLCAGLACGRKPPKVFPIAVVGEDREVPTGSLVRLEGGTSFDGDGDPIFFSWSFQRKPAGSEAELNDRTVQNPSFVPDLPGEYAIRLMVRDAWMSSLPADVVITAVGDAVTPPTARPGEDRTVATGTVVQLDGSESTSPVEGTVLTWRWWFDALPAGSTAALNDATVANPSFHTDQPGDYALWLEVHDGIAVSPPARVVITAEGPLADLRALAGDDGTAEVDQVVVLDGSGSLYPAGTLPDYRWRLTGLPAGSRATLSDPDVVNPWFVPDVEGDYALQLSVAAGGRVSAPDTVVITATPRTTVSVLADAGPDQKRPEGAIIALDGTGSTGPTGESLVLDWRFLDLPPGSLATLNDTGLLRPSFTADVPGRYEVHLTVTGAGVSDEDTVVIDVFPSTDANVPPVADPGPSVATLVGRPVQLDGSGSWDADGDRLTYRWVLRRPAGSQAVLSQTDSAVTGFIPDVAGLYRGVLRVNDGTEWSDLAAVRITADLANTPPYADAGQDFTVILGDLTTLSGDRTWDPDGDALTWTWWIFSRPDGSTVTLIDADTATPSFRPDALGEFGIRLAVFDGTVWSTPPATLLITVEPPNEPPLAFAGPLTLSIVNFVPAQLDGTRSRDPEGVDLTYAWSIIARPAGSSANLSGDTTATPSFLADVAGNYRVELEVSDGVNTATARTSILAETVCCLTTTAPSPNPGVAGREVSFEARVETTSGYTAAGVPLQVDLISGDGDVLAGSGPTGSAGTRSVRYVPISEGPHRLAVRCADCVTTNVVTVVFPVEPPRPASVHLVTTPLETNAPGPISLTFEVRDLWDNLTTSNNSTRFGLRLSGGGRFGASASVGTLVSGGGTNSVVVRAQGGKVTLPVRAPTPQTVYLTYLDLDNLAFFPSLLFSGAATDLLTDGQTTQVQVDMPGASTWAPTGDGTLELTFFSDIGDPDENVRIEVEGVNLGTRFATAADPGIDCYSMKIQIPLPLAELPTMMADNRLDLSFRTSAPVEQGICFQSTVGASVSIPGRVPIVFR